MEVNRVTNTDEKDVDACLSGNKLIGDDYDVEAIRDWFIDEGEGYAELGAKDRDSYSYKYHALNEMHGFAALPDYPVGHALGLGSAYGDEFCPIINRIKRITILDPSEQFKVTEIKGVPVDYQKPSPSGVIPFDDSDFELVTCLGVLHHIPNVSFVTSEIGRVLKRGCHALIREPCISMGDWRQQRHVSAVFPCDSCIGRSTPQGWTLYHAPIVISLQLEKSEN